MLAEGRASEILELGDGRVLRRFKAGGRPAREAEIMEHARTHGYPVPRCWKCSTTHSCSSASTGRPCWRSFAGGPGGWPVTRERSPSCTRRLHEIPFEGERLIHLDFHPDNVLLSQPRPGRHRLGERARGQPGARRRDDVGDLRDERRRAGTRVHTALPPARRSGRGSRRASRRWDFRVADPNVTDDERELVRSLVRRMS